MNSLHADVLVIGFGKGGKIVAAKLGRLGKRVVLVERPEHMYGGTCPNVAIVGSRVARCLTLEVCPNAPAVVRRWASGCCREGSAITASFSGRRAGSDRRNSGETT